MGGMKTASEYGVTRRIRSATASTTPGSPAQVVEQLDAEADVALLVQRHLPHALAEAGQQVALLEVVGDEVLAGLGQQRLDDDVVHRHRPRERDARCGRSAARR